MQQQRVIIAPEDISLDDYSLIMMWHPKLQSASYMVNTTNTFDVLELQQLQRDGAYSSWFVDQNIVEDGSLFMLTRIDPYFIILHLLEAYGKDSYRNFQEIITEVEGEQLDSLRKVEEFLDFSVFCKKQEISDINYWKVDETKVMDWLHKKFTTIKEYLVTSKYVEPSAVSSFIRADKENEEQLACSAIGFLSEYLSDSWITKLKAKEGIVEVKNSGRKFRSLEDIYQYSHQSGATSNFAFSAGAKAKPKSKSSSFNRSGMKGLGSFFGKKKE